MRSMLLRLCLLIYFVRRSISGVGKTFLKEEMPKFTDTDTIELHHLRSFPLLAMMSDAGSFKLKTSGIALRSTMTSIIIVLEFKPVNISACFLPIVGKNVKDGIGGTVNGTLTWDKRATVSYQDNIDSKYWMHSTFLGVINGVVYRNYLNWVEEYLEIGPGKYFTPQSICSAVEEESCFTLPSTGDTFLASSLAIFAELSVQMHAIIPPRASEVHLFSFTEPRLFSLEAGVEGVGGGGVGGEVGGGGGGAEGVAGGGEGVGVQDDDEERVEEIGAGHEGIESGSAGRRDNENRKGRKMYGVSSRRRKDSMHTANDTEGRYRPLRGPEYTSRGADLGSDSMSVRSRGLSHRQTSTPNTSPTRGRSSRIHPRPPSHFPSHYPSHSPSPYSTPTTHRSPSQPPSSLHSLSPSLPPSLPPSESFDSQPSSQPSSYTSPSTDLEGTYLPTMNSTYQSTVAINGSADFNSSVWYDEKEKEDTRFNTTNFKDSDVTEYFRTLIGCMQAYQLEYFADALKSCMKQSDGFIHLEGNKYYHIRPRHPFAFKHDYWQAIPMPTVIDKGGRDISDIVISAAILVITLIGLSAALWKLKMFEFLLVRNKGWRHRTSASAPTGGGYSSGSSELPTYHVWGGGEEIAAPSSSYFKLQTEDLDEVWVPKGIKGSKDRNSDDSSSGNSSSNDSGDSRDSSNCNTRSNSTTDLKLNISTDDDDSKRDKGGKFSGEDPARRHYGSGMSSALRSKEDTQSRIRSNSVQRGNGSISGSMSGSGSGSMSGSMSGSGSGGFNDLIFDKKNLPYKEVPEWCNVELNNKELFSNNKDDVSNYNNSDATKGLDVLAPKGLSISTSDEAPHTHYSSIINYRSKLARRKGASRRSRTTGRNSISTLPEQNSGMEKDKDENSRDSNIKKTREYGINDIEMVVSNTTTSTTKDVSDDFSFSLSGIPSPPMSPLGDLDTFKKPDSFYMLNDRTFDENSDGQNRQDSATVSIQNNQNNDNGDYMNDTANDNTNDDTNENGNDNVSFSSSDKQYRNFNFKI